MLDSAPLWVAAAEGMFAEEGVNVNVSCELGLATTCGMLIDERLHGACLPAPLPVLLTAGGTGGARVAMRAVAMCSWQGIGMIMNPEPRKSAAPRIGVASPGASSRLLLHRLAQAPGSPVPAAAEAMTLAAGQLPEFLREQVIDGFLAVDPLPAVARAQGLAQPIADSATLYPHHPGSVLALRADVLEARPALAAALERAIGRARAWCSERTRQQELWRRVLAMPPYADLPAEVVKRLLADAPGDKGWASVIYVPPKGAAAANAETFVDQACRMAAGPAARALNYKTEIARVYPPRVLNPAAAATT